ncbi:uncharacterized protein FOMMEDRAFT_22047 [Fomitiporia mediterranea MF3/22]|uniref:uncharacterized protein n=1 Tax=Fomitiporia mediterranea (strain MF3/22) TaxID=694068 RepID=UPI0004409587|nr:uncharacterized protein FOMMEDRAFT_22047 [Fomitiporia mediterranea MF3/22]EJD01686.1 hypothetical protein FOMMEDRAFT_22047 [Fomitiporia mediterranea MF3/22]
MAPLYHGSCLCKEIEFEVAAEPIIVSCCHCKNCKKYTGTVFTTNVVFAANNSIRITKGENLVSAFKDTVQDSGNSLSRKFCSLCGSPLYNTGGDFGRTLAVFYSALDDFNVVGDDGIAKEAKPQVEYYSKVRTSWVRSVEGAEQPKTKPGRD